MKCALEVSCIRLARGYNVLDVEIAECSWSRRTGQNVRKHMGDYAADININVIYTQRIMRACCGAVIHPDIVGLHIPKFRHVFSGVYLERRKALRRMMHLFTFMQRKGLGAMLRAKNEWPTFHKKQFAAHVRDRKGRCIEIRDTFLQLPITRTERHHGDTDLGCQPNGKLSPTDIQ